MKTIPFTQITDQKFQAKYDTVFFNRPEAAVALTFSALKFPGELI
jgi:hypothetical protein